MKKRMIYLSLLVPVLFFTLYVLMVLIGMAFNLCGAQDGFYCDVYTKLPAVVLTAMIAAGYYWRNAGKPS